MARWKPNGSHWPGVWEYRLTSIASMSRVPSSDLDEEIAREQGLLEGLRDDERTLIRELHDARLEEEQRRSAHKLYQAELQDSWDKLTTLRARIGGLRRKVDDAAVEEAEAKTTLAAMADSAGSSARLSHSYIVSTKMRLRDELVEQLTAQEGLLQGLRRQIQLRSEALLNSSSGSSAFRSIEESLSLRQSLVKAASDLERAEADFLDLSLRLENLKLEIKQSLPKNSPSRSSQPALRKEESNEVGEGAQTHSDYSLYEVLAGEANVVRLSGEEVGMYRRRLEKCLSSLLVLERQLQEDLDEKADCVRRAKEEYREAELKRLRVELQLSNLEPIIRQREASMLELLGSSPPQSSGAVRGAAISETRALLETRRSLGSPLKGAETRRAHPSPFDMVVSKNNLRELYSPPRFVSPETESPLHHKKIDFPIDYLEQRPRIPIRQTEQHPLDINRHRDISTSTKDTSTEDLMLQGGANEHAAASQTPDFSTVASTSSSRSKSVVSRSVSSEKRAKENVVHRDLSFNASPMSISPKPTRRSHSPASQGSSAFSKRSSSEPARMTSRVTPVEEKQTTKSESDDPLKRLHVKPLLILTTHYDVNRKDT